MFSDAASSVYLNSLRTKLSNQIFSAKKRGSNSTFSYDDLPLIIRNELERAGYILTRKYTHSWEIDWLEATNKEFPPEDEEELFWVIDAGLNLKKSYPRHDYTEEEAKKAAVVDFVTTAIGEFNVTPEDLIERMKQIILASE